MPHAHELARMHSVLAGMDRWAVVQGDCREVLPLIGDRAADHVITDPPYEEEAHTKQRRSLKDATQKRGALNKGEVRRIGKALSFGAITEADRILVSREFARIARRWVVAFCQVEAVAAWRSSLKAGGLEWVRGGIWYKPNGMPQFTGDRPGQGFESLAIAHQPGRKSWNGGGRHAVWVVNLDHNAGGGGQNDHETKKPEKLMIDLVSDFTDPDDLIVDPYCGSGTTLVAALRLGRRCIGIELDPKHAVTSQDRCAAETIGLSLRDVRSGQQSLLARLDSRPTTGDRKCCP